MPFVKHQKVTFLSTSLTKYVENLYMENYKTHWKKIRLPVNGEIFYVYGLEDSKLLGCQIFPNWSRDLM